MGRQHASETLSPKFPLKVKVEADEQRTPGSEETKEDGAESGDIFHVRRKGEGPRLSRTSGHRRRLFYGRSRSPR